MRILGVVATQRVEGSVLVLGLRDVAGQWGAEKAGVQEGLHLVGFEEVVAGVTGLCCGVAEAAAAVAHLVEHTEHVEEADEHGDLHQHGEAAHGHVDAVVLLQLGHLHGHPLAVVGVLLLDGLNLRLQFRHLLGGADLLHHRVEEDESDRHREEHDGECPGSAGDVGTAVDGQADGTE